MNRQTLPEMPLPRIEILRLYGCHFDASTIWFLHFLSKQKCRKLDVHVDEEFITIHRETILTVLDETPSAMAWNELETVWEMLDTNNLDFLEIPSDMCCPNPDCVNRKHKRP